MSKSYRTIKVVDKKEITWLFLNRPDKLNAINDLMLTELSEAFERIEENPKSRCVITVGEGQYAFSTGADLSELYKLNSETAAEFSAKGQKVMSKPEELSKPVIAAINGYTLGGGLELALSCDFRIATNNSEFGFPEIKLGFIPGWGGTQRLTNLVGAKAKQLILLGERIGADQALKIGLVDKIVPPNELEKETKKLARKLCEHSSLALKFSKQIINSAINDHLKDGLRREQKYFATLLSGKEPKEKIEEFLENRETKNKKTAMSE